MSWNDASLRKTLDEGWSKEDFKDMKTVGSQIRRAIEGAINLSDWEVSKDWRDTGLTYKGADTKQAKKDIAYVVKALQELFPGARSGSKKLTIQDNDVTQYTYEVSEPKVRFGHWNKIGIGARVPVADFFVNVG